MKESDKKVTRLSFLLISELLLRFRSVLGCSRPKINSGCTACFKKNNNIKLPLSHLECVLRLACQYFEWLYLGRFVTFTACNPSLQVTNDVNRGLQFTIF